MILNWTEDIAVGVDIIDEQHKKLFEYLNDFADAIDNNTGAGEISKITRFLDNYVIEHFDTEEKMMKKVSCPDMEEHIGQHRIFMEFLTEVKRTYAIEGGSEELATMLRSRLCNWLFSHILILDRRMGPFIRD